MKKITTLQTAAELALSGKVKGELDASMTIEVEGQRWTCYTVAVSDREFSCYCNEGTATFVIDTYGERMTFELYDWSTDA